MEDLSHVKGMGPATLERNREAILLGDTATDGKASTKAAPAKAKTKASKASDE